MKKLLLLALTATFALSLSACKDDDPIVCDDMYVLDGDVCVYDGFEVAMITDSGGIDDGSFNQGTWEGIVEFATANDLTYKYYKPLEVSDASYLDAIGLAVEGNAQIIVTPGYLFESSIYAAQDLYPDVKFVLIDGTPHDPTWTTWRTEDNVMPILFDEHEAGFLAGYSAVLEGYTKLGFTGGMAVPAVVKFGIGFIAGAYYAAEMEDVAITLGDATYTYFGGFGPDVAYKNIALSWYQVETQLIFSAAGGAGQSVMSAAADSDAVVIGVDIDQAGDSPTVLTSAMKQLGNAVKQALQAYVDGTFVGGTTQTKNAVNDGVALPMDTSRFLTFTQADYDAIFALLVAGTVDVPSTYVELVAFLDDATLNIPSAVTVNGE